MRTRHQQCTAIAKSPPAPCPPPPLPVSSYVLTTGLMPSDKHPDVSCSTAALTQCPVSDSLGLGQTEATHGRSWCSGSRQLKSSKANSFKATRHPETPPSKSDPPPPTPITSVWQPVYTPTVTQHTEFIERFSMQKASLSAHKPTGGV